MLLICVQKKVGCLDVYKLNSSLLSQVMSCPFPGHVGATFVPHKTKPVISGQVAFFWSRNNSSLPKCVQKIIRCLDVYKRNS